MPYEGNGADGRHYWLTPDSNVDRTATPMPRPKPRDGWPQQMSLGGLS